MNIIHIPIYRKNDLAVSYVGMNMREYDSVFLIGEGWIAWKEDIEVNVEVIEIVSDSCAEIIVDSTLEEVELQFRIGNGRT